MRNAKWIIAALLLTIICGCTPKQLRQEFIGYSAGDVRGAKQKQVLNFDKNAQECYDGIIAELNKLGAIVRENRRAKYILADNFQDVFKSCIDTTQLGILVIPAGDNACRVEVASGNIPLSEFVAGKISASFEPVK